MHCLLAAYIAKYPRSSCHQLRLATCRGMNTVKPIKFATFRLERHWQFSGDVGVGFRAYMWENKCACYGKTVEDFHRCSRAAAGPLPGSFRIAGSSPANKQSCTRLQSFWGVAFTNNCALWILVQTLLVLSLSQHLPFHTGAQPLGRSGH